MIKTSFEFYFLKISSKMNSLNLNDKINLISIKQNDFNGKEQKINLNTSRHDDTETIKSTRIEKISKSYSEIIESIGENPSRQGLQNTPTRAAQALIHFTKGYEESLNGFKFLN